MKPPAPFTPLTDAEIDDLVRGYSDEKLADLHESAAQQPGTDWHLRLSAEMRRRRNGEQQ